MASNLGTEPTHFAVIEMLLLTISLVLDRRPAYPSQTKAASGLQPEMNCRDKRTASRDKRQSCRSTTRWASWKSGPSGSRPPPLVWLWPSRSPAVQS